MKEKKAFEMAGIFAIAFILLIILLKTVDVAAVGPEGTSVGLSHLNRWVHDLFGEHKVLYYITKYLGILSIMMGSVYACLGLYQLLTRKSILKVDKCILTLGVLYAMLGVIYAIFTKININLRPMICWDETALEPSFPSSHTILTCTIMGSLIMLMDRYVKNEKLSYILKLVCMALMVEEVLGRLICGVHWFTDIIGGMIFSAMLLALYKGATIMVEKSGKNGE